MCVYSLHICMYMYEDLSRTNTGNFKVTVTNEALHTELSLEKLYLSFSKVMPFSSKAAMLFNRTLCLSQMNRFFQTHSNKN